VAFPAWLAVAIGGGTGAVLRWALSGALAGRSPVEGFPLGTWVVNLVGCFAIGVATVVAERTGWNPTVRLASITGILGGFTTFSAFGAETMGLMSGGRSALAAAYALASVVGGLGAVGAGRMLAEGFPAR